MTAAKTIVKVRKDKQGKVTHVVYEDGKVETLAQAIKRAQKKGITNFEAVTPKVGAPYLRKTKDQKVGLADLPVEGEEKPAAAKSGCARPKKASK
jgi:hypothetical protein